MAGDGTVHREPAFAGLRPSDDELVGQVLGRAEVHLVGRLAGERRMRHGRFVLLDEEGDQRCVIAQIDVSFSNSLIEAWWRSLKHRWLFLHPLDNIATVKRVVEFYVTEHNERIPHGAFEGQTPDEMYFGRGAQVPDRPRPPATRGAPAARGAQP